jgi:hypothetical protein
MTADAFRRALRAFCRHAPLAPFIIEFQTGDSIEITHPEAVMIDRRLAIATQPDRCQRLFDSSSVCQLLNVPR